MLATPAICLAMVIGAVAQSVPPSSGSAAAPEPTLITDYRDLECLNICASSAAVISNCGSPYVLLF
jgi:hypothetical protein